MLVLHGGPGINYDYLDDVVAELADRYQVATFQQRGLAPSTEQGKFTIAEAVADIVAVLDALGWETAYLVGHSWGGHLALHAAARIPDRLAGVLAVEPLGAVGDGGLEAFAAERLARVPPADQERVRDLGEKEAAGKSTSEDDVEALSLMWPGYFADPAAAPPMPPLRFSQPADRGLGADLMARLPDLESMLSSISVPLGVIVGERSPMPPSAGTRTAERIPGAWSHIEPGAGHLVWHEAPGCLLAAMDRLVAEA